MNTIQLVVDDVIFSFAIQTALEVEVDATDVDSTDIDSSSSSANEGNKSSIIYAFLTAVTAEEDNYHLAITKEWIDHLSDTVAQILFRTKPKTIQKLFKGELGEGEVKANRDTLTLTIETDFTDFTFVLIKEKVDENALLRRHIARLDRRVHELEAHIEREESPEYIDMPAWASIEKEVVALFDRLDPDYIKFKSEQVSTTREAMVQKFFSVFSTEQKYAAWLTLLFHQEKKMIFSADAATANSCGAGQIEGMNHGRFKRSAQSPKFRKFFVAKNTAADKSRIVLTALIGVICGCAAHKYGSCGSAVVSYIDY